MSATPGVLGALVLLTGGLGLGACIEKPSEEECEEFSKHMVTLLAQAGEPERRVRKLGTKHKDKMIEACVRGGTRQQVECTLGADSLDEVAERCKR